jgi:hypothetical protein
MALKLFLQKRPRYASALTLAGASEEIFARLLQSRGEITSLKHWYVNKRLNWPKHWPELTWSAHAAEENFARNAAKHLISGNELSVVFDLEDAAAMMLYRACANYEWLGLVRTWRMRRFDTWFGRWAA